MQCDCINETVMMVTDSLAEDIPGSGTFCMQASGYNLSINLSTGKASRRFCVEVSGHFKAPKKTGGMKRVNKTVSVLANYCPMCGKLCEAGSQT